MLFAWKGLEGFLERWTLIWETYFPFVGGTGGLFEQHSPGPDCLVARATGIQRKARIGWAADTSIFVVCPFVVWPRESSKTQIGHAGAVGNFAEGFARRELVCYLV